MVMEKTAESTGEKVSAKLRALADLFEAIENEHVTPELHKLAQEISRRELAPELRTVLGMVGGTGPSMLEEMNGDFRAELEHALRRMRD